MGCFSKLKYIYQGLAVQGELDLHLFACKIITSKYGQLKTVICRMNKESSKIILFQQA